MFELIVSGLNLVRRIGFCELGCLVGLEFGGLELGKGMIRLEYGDSEFLEKGGKVLGMLIGKTKSR